MTYRFFVPRFRESVWKSRRAANYPRALKSGRKCVLNRVSTRENEGEKGEGVNRRICKVDESGQSSGRIRWTNIEMRVQTENVREKRMGEKGERAKEGRRRGWRRGDDIGIVTLRPRRWHGCQQSVQNTTRKLVRFTHRYGILGLRPVAFSTWCFFVNYFHLFLSLSLSFLLRIFLALSLFLLDSCLIAKPTQGSILQDPFAPYPNNVGTEPWKLGEKRERRENKRKREKFWISWTRRFQFLSTIQNEEETKRERERERQE